MPNPNQQIRMTHIQPGCSLSLSFIVLRCSGCATAPPATHNGCQPLLYTSNPARPLKKPGYSPKYTRHIPIASTRSTNKGGRQDWILLHWYCGRLSQPIGMLS
jgi:hypothetical protein